MPPYNYSGAYLVTWMRGIARRLANLEKAYTGIKDPNGITRVKYGLLPNGDYGMMYFAPDPVAGWLSPIGEQLWPSTSAYEPGPISTSSTAYSVGSGSPELTAFIGASGDADVSVSCYVSTGATNLTGIVGLVIDGGTPVDICALGGGSTEVAGNVSSERRLSQWLGGTLTPDENHTFTLAQRSTTSGQSVQFDAMSIRVTPI